MARARVMASLLRRDDPRWLKGPVQSGWQGQLWM